MKIMKFVSILVCLFVVMLGIATDRLAQKNKDVLPERENVVLKNDYFLLIREQEQEYNHYRIYFNEISASDTILNLKRIIEYCVQSEKDNPYSIYFEIDDVKKFNCAFLENINHRKHLSQEEMYDSLRMACRYKGFLRKHLCLIGCVLSDSVIFTMTDMGCCMNEDKDLYLDGEVCIYFNWQKISNASVSDETRS